jgi:nicotinamidase-related amidase
MATALLLIDVQRNMLEGPEPVPAAAEVRPALASLLERARAAGSTIVHVQNDGTEGDPDVPHTEGWQLVFPPADGELVLRKDEQDTFASNPELAAELRARDVDHVVVAGMQSELCVAATGRAALDHGFRVSVARGAHATYGDGPTAAEIAAGVERQLAEAGADVAPADSIAFAAT